MSEGAKPGDPRFFTCAGPHSLAAIAALLGAEIPEGGKLIHGVAPLQNAGPDDVSFLDNRRYAELLSTTKAGAVILHPDFADKVPSGTVALATPEPYVGWAKVSALFFPYPEAKAGIHPRAIVDKTAIVHHDAEIGPGAVVDARAEIGAGTIIGPLAVIEEGVIIGEDCRIHARAVISHAVLGKSVTVYPGACIGQDGFGFAISKAGFIPVPQLGRVLIGDGAEIGANTTIDRGSATDTIIGPGVHIDNLVQIAHNVRLGANAVIIAQAGIAGSSQVGPGAIIAAQAGVAGHVTIGTGARVGAKAGVMNDVTAGEDVMGAPATNSKAFFREVVTLRRLAGTVKKTPKTGN
jgi:UDP-3-O-[3-hydroxymyristoyl] glucosamine N-acyltransferase